ncbi:condensation domain-containing protein [Streptomyces mirabilis]|uniref:condensation domain-containing protein n=1 Tax=Streptomyces mirabilis TaxID=68239 RepID=UPI003668C709
MWYAQQLAPGKPGYNVSEYLEIHGDLDVDLFVAALRRTLDEAETLRLRFRVTGGEPWQYIDDSDDHPIEVIDVSAAADPRAAAEKLMRSGLRHPVDLAEGPMVSYMVFRLGDDRFIWHMRAHHLVLDGHSTWVIASRVSQIYTALREGRAPEAGALRPLSELIAADLAYQDSPDYSRDQAYWLDALSDLPESDEPDKQQLRRLPETRERHTEDLGPVDAAGLNEAARRLDINPAKLMIAAALYQHRVTGARDVVIGVPVRGARAYWGIPRNTSNVLPTRLRIDQRTTVGELAEQASRTIGEALRHQHYRYEDILRDLKLLDGGALFSLVVNVMPFDCSMRVGDCTAHARNLSSGPIDNVRIDIYDRLAGTGI